MQKEIMSELKSKKYDVLIATAAPADWRMLKPFKNKISTHNVNELELKLRATPKIIESVKKIRPNILLIPFKAELNLSEKKMVEKALELMKSAKADLIAINDVGKKGVGFREDTNELYVIDKNRSIFHIPLSSKHKVARRLLDIIKKKLDD